MTSERMWTIALLAALPLPAAAQFPAASPEEAVQAVEAKFEPAQAKPGETVTLKITVRLADGWSTYPTEQPEKTASTYTTRITLPESDAVRFGAVKDPPNPAKKAEPLLGIKELRYYPGGGVWESKATVSPQASSGKVTLPVQVRLLVCDKDNCLPPKRLTLEPVLTIGAK